MVEIQEWDRGETIRIQNTYTDSAGVAVDPDTVELKIYEPNGSLKTTVTYAGGDIARSSTGVYYYDYSIPSDGTVGWWISKWAATIDTQTDQESNQFYVRDPEEKLYCTVEEVWNRAGVGCEVITRDEVIPLIKDSMAEIDSMMGKSFQYGTSVTEWFDTDQPDENIERTSVFLRYTPVISITSVEEYDTDGTLSTTYTSDDYWIDMNTGYLKLLDDEFSQQVHRVKVVYSYGYEAVPRKISALCAILSAIRLFEFQIGGTYNSITSWSAAGLSAGVGEPYMNMSRDIELLSKERDKLIASIGRLRQSILIV